jgi:pimeloyl-ACP methyl ester carboxylesterase
MSESATETDVIHWSRLIALALVIVLGLGSSCSDSPDDAGSDGSASPSATAASDEFAGQVTLDDGRELFLQCSGAGSPTVVLEGGDDDTSQSYAYAVDQLAAVTRTCAYDRANLGQSAPDSRCRGLRELVGDLEQVLRAGEVPGPYVLVGTSGGGHITAGYAVGHADQIAGMVFVEVPPPFPNPPADLVAETRCDAPGNIESRDYLQVEQDAWQARREIGDIPVTVISTKYSPAEVAAAPPLERPLVRANVERQRGWLVLSPRAKQVVVHTGHAVEEADPQLVIDAILAVVEDAQG